MTSDGCWHDIGLKSPKKSGIYILEQVNNDHEYGYFKKEDNTWHMRIASLRSGIFHSKKLDTCILTFFSYFFTIIV